MSEHNWDAINREISESIELIPRYRPSVVSSIRSSKAKAWFWDPITKLGWRARDWREPTAAMELLKRMPEPALHKLKNGWGCLPDWQLIRVKEQFAPNVEEAIVLAYYAGLKGGEQAGR